MTQRRIVYLTALAASLFFYWAYHAWLSGLLLTAVIFLPGLSLLLSLPAMVSCKVSLQCPDHVTVGTPARAVLDVGCRLPVPLIFGELRLFVPASNKKKRLKPGAFLPTAHCGAFRVRCKRLWVCDYLGLFRLPVRLREDRLVLVRPKAYRPEQLPDLSRYFSGITLPKPGGGYAENHELRLYRPGDSLHQIHWKLSAKTGKLIIREPMEARQDAAVLTMELSGQPELLDRKLGQLLGMSTYLSENGIRHRIFCYTGSGMSIFSISNEQEAQDALDKLLQMPPAEADVLPAYPKAIWRHHIGGDGNEA